MAIKDVPGITTMPKSERDWTKFILDLSTEIAGIDGGGGPDGNFVTLDTAQTITATKTFTVNPLFNTNPLWNNNNVGTQINSLAADAVPDGTADYVVTYDASTDSPKKVLLDAVGGGGSSDDDELLHWFFE